MLLVAASLAAERACAADIAGSAPVVHGAQVMLYVSQPLWSRGLALRVYGLRMVRQRTFDSNARSALIDFQLRSQSDFRIEFGRRLTWSISRREFGGTPSMVMLEMPSKSGLENALTREPWDSTSVVVRRLAISGGQPSIDAFIPPSWPSTRSWYASAVRNVSIGGRRTVLMRGQFLKSRNVVHRTDYVAGTEVAYPPESRPP
jgi:hypothetical protein